MEILTIPREHYVQNPPAWVCPGCATPRKGTGFVAVTVMETNLDRAPLHPIREYSIGAIRRDLVECMGEEIVRRDLHLGTLVDGKGKLRDDWFPFIGRHRIIVRGRTQGSCYRVCETCSGVFYSSHGSDFLYPAPPDDADIWDMGFGGLIVSRAVAERIEQKSWKRLMVNPISVATSAEDGFPELTTCDFYQPR